MLCKDLISALIIHLNRSNKYTTFNNLIKMCSVISVVNMA